MRKFSVLCCLALLLLSAAGIHAQDDGPSVIEYQVTGTFANLRGGPGTTYAIVGNAEGGESLWIYNEEPRQVGWLRIWREGREDAWIADWLVEKAPQRFYPPFQEPVAVASGYGNTITDVLEIPWGIYRIDAEIDDNSFILEAVILDGDCRDRLIFNELDFGASNLTLSGLWISHGCSVIFETDNVNNDWKIEIRDLLDADALQASLLAVEDGAIISGTGRALTMATQLPRGFWSINAVVQDRAFILRAHVLAGECDDTHVFNELGFGANRLEIDTIYRVIETESCVIFWETNNVEGDWELTFEKLR